MPGTCMCDAFITHHVLHKAASRLDLVMRGPTLSTQDSECCTIVDIVCWNLDTTAGAGQQQQQRKQLHNCERVHNRHKKRPTQHGGGIQQYSCSFLNKDEV